MDLKTKIIQEVKKRKLERELVQKVHSNGSESHYPQQGRVLTAEQSTDFSYFSQYKNFELHKMAADKLDIASPFFKVHDGLSSATSIIAGRELVNFSSYDYLGINGDPRQIEKAETALHTYGVSSSASRMVSGEREIQRELERKLAALHGVADAAVFVSGHATNVSTIGSLFDHNDLIIHDELIHNSVLEGIKLSRAQRSSFSHNNLQQLEKVLVDKRKQHRRVLIVVEGLYSMDGDFPDLVRLVALKNQHNALLMVDEAHSLGVMGETGRGIAEYFSIDPTSVDIWMGTLSKALASTGGYIAGSQALIDIVKTSVPGFVYSVGLAPVLAAAAVAAIDIMLEEPERVKNLQANAALFDRLARDAGVDTGRNCGFSVIPIMAAGSASAAKSAEALFKKGVNVQPIIYPAVEEKMARLRFFICASHSEAQIRQAVQALAEVKPLLTKS